MKIVFITLGFFPDQVGGGEVYAYNLSRQIQTQGHEVTILRRITNSDEHYTLNQTKFEDLDVFAIKTMDFPVSAWVKDDRLYSLASDFFRGQKPDVVHVFLFAGMLSVVEAARDAGIPIVFSALDFGMFCANFHLKRKNGDLCDGLMVETKCANCL